MELLCTEPLMAGEQHLETGEEAQTEKEKECDGVNVDSRSANSAHDRGKATSYPGRRMFCHCTNYLPLLLYEYDS